MAELIIEVQDHLKRTKMFYPIKKFPVRIGRGYSNDIILEDPHVCSEHLVINESEEGWSAEDLDTKNGVHVLEKGGKQKQLQLLSGDMIVIGKTHIRFVEPGHPVAPTKVLRERNSLLDVSRAAAIVWALISIFIIGISVENFLSSSKEIHVEKLVADSLPVVGGVLVWTALWALLAYIVRRRMFFKFLLAVTIIYYLADTFLAILLEYLSFNINSMWFVDVVSYVTSGLLLVALFYVSMSKALTVSKKRRMFLAHVFSWTIVAVIGFVVYANKPEFNRNPEYSAELKPPFARIVSADDLDEFMEKTDSLFNN